jgi:hypothetical protein
MLDTLMLSNKRSLKRNIPQTMKLKVKMIITKTFFHLTLKYLYLTLMPKKIVCTIILMKMK